MWEHAGIIIAVCGLLLNLVVTVIGGVRAFSKLELSLSEKIDASGREIDERIDQQSRQFGETVSALRQKITDVELYVRDNYVRRESFYKVVDDLGVRIEKRIDKLERKLDGGP